MHVISQFGAQSSPFRASLPTNYVQRFQIFLRLACELMSFGFELALWELPVDEALFLLSGFLILALPILANLLCEPGSPYAIHHYKSCLAALIEHLPWI